MKRIWVLLGVMAVFATSWVTLRQVPLTVIGQPTTTGLLQQQREAPFFADLAENTGIPLAVDYKPLNTVGLKDTHQLQMLKDGVFDLVSLRFIQNSEAEPSLQGIDLVGLSGDFDTARTVVRHYAGTVDRYLRESYDAKLLGVWTFGPQELFCSTPVRGIDDLAGRKVRVASPSIASLITALGGTPAVIPFDDTRAALSTGLIDCAVSSATSATSAGWLDHTAYYFPLPVHYGLNGYAISLRTWNQLTGREQTILQTAFDDYTDDLWQFARELHRATADCITGRPCLEGQPYHEILVPPSARDLRVFREVARTRVWPQWAERCDDVHPGCSAEWRAEVLENVG